MRKFFILAVAFCLTLASVSVGAGEGDYSLLRTKYRAWNMLCLEFRPHECGSIKPPLVVRARMNDRLNGYYNGGAAVYINRKLYGLDREKTLVHEMSHYLDTRLGINPPIPVKLSDKDGIFGLCLSEKRAWRVTDLYWLRMKRDERVVGHTWVAWYDHCRQFADKLYPDKFDEPLPDNSYGWLRDERFIWARSEGR